MEGSIEAVETGGEAVSPGVEPEVAEAPANDPVAELEAAKAELEKVRRDRDNYRKGMLSAKGKLREESEDFDPTDPESVKALIAKQVQDSLAESSESQATSKLEALAARQARELKELKLAVKSKQASTSISGGSASGSGSAQNSVSKTSYFSEEQKAELRKRGKTDAQIEKIAAIAMGDPTAPRGRI